MNTYVYKKSEYYAKWRVFFKNGTSRASLRAGKEKRAFSGTQEQEGKVANEANPASPPMTNRGKKYQHLLTSLQVNPTTKLPCS